MSLKNTFENKLLDHLFGGGDYSRLATVYIGLSTTVSAEDGTNFTEPTDSAYARQAMDNDAGGTLWDSASGGSKSNNAIVSWNTATEDWGTILELGIWDAVSAGNLIASGALTVSKQVTTGDTMRFNIGDLTVTLD